MSLRGLVQDTLVTRHSPRFGLRSSMSTSGGGTSSTGLARVAPLSLGEVVARSVSSSPSPCSTPRQPLHWATGPSPSGASEHLSCAFPARSRTPAHFSAKQPHFTSPRLASGMPSCDTPAGRCASLSSLPLPPSLPLSHSPPPLRRCLIKGPEHRLDISFSASGDAPTRDHPHGIIGQSFATPGRVRNGKTDHYPFHGYYVTSAQAEGAIEGTASQYEVVSPYATPFTFSRFGAAVRALPRLKAGATGRVDASSIDRVPVMEVAEAPPHTPPPHTHTEPFADCYPPPPPTSNAGSPRRPRALPPRRPRAKYRQHLSV